MKMAQQFLTIVLSLGMLATVCAANKKPAKEPAKKPVPKEAPTGPFVEIVISSRVMSYIDGYDKLKEELMKTYEKRDNNFNHRDVKKVREKIKKHKKKLDDAIDKANHSLDNATKGIEKDLEKLSAKLDSATEATEGELLKKISRLEKQLESKDSVREAYEAFSRYCHVPKKAVNETDLKGTAFDYRGKSMPKIGTAQGYRAIVFCSSLNKQSLAALATVKGLDLEKVVAVVCDEDDALFEKNFGGSKKTKYEVVRDGKFAQAHRYNVKFVPTIFIGNPANKCIYAMVGISSKQKAIMRSLIRGDKKKNKK